MGYFHVEETIAALSSALGGPIAVIRMSGPQAVKILENLSSKLLKIEHAKAYITELRTFKKELIDTAVAVVFLGPKSFTGQDVVELHVHGSSFIVTKLLNTIYAAEARPALPGEFSFRAVAHGKMNVFQASAIQDLLQGTSEYSVQVALNKLKGIHASFLETLGQKLKRLMSLAEAGIDFSDQDLEEVSLQKLKEQTQEILVSLNQLLDTFERGKLLSQDFRVAIVGLPNAGKSSFFNCLCGENISIVSEVQGTTRDIVHETLTLPSSLGSMRIRFEDTAGMRATENFIEQMGVDKAYESAKKAHYILFLIRVDSNWLEHQVLIETLKPYAFKTCILFAQADRGYLAENLKQMETDLRKLGYQHFIFVSSVNKTGIKEICENIAKYYETLVEPKPSELILTRIQHFQAVSQAKNYLCQALQSESCDLFTADLWQAVITLAPLIGSIQVDDVLEKIFSEFCIGK